MYESLTPDGICIVSDKMLTSQFLVNRYHDFKRSQGVSDEEIAKKAAMIRGVLVPLPLEWYLRTLRTIGFKTVEVFDADWCFASILCAK
jgi:tRNA (cmo5U34)-methyltransferase